MSQPPLLLIDGSSWLFRAFYALPPLTSPDGEATGAVYGMGNMLKKLIDEYQPKKMVVVFDPPGKTFRNDIYADYKANRPPVPPELKSQFPLIIELLEARGIPVLQVTGVEADDVLGTLATRATDDEVLLVTGDKDMAQLVNEQVNMLDTMKNKRLDSAGVVEKFGVPPEKIIDYLALMGDNSDNIPGVPKVGPKTAAKWLNQFGSLDDLIAAADEVKGKVGESLRDHLEQLPLAKDLATIRCDLELPPEAEKLEPQAGDVEKQAALYRRLGFTRWLDDLGSTDSQGDQEVAPTAPAEGEYLAVTTEAELSELLEAISGVDVIAVDTETTSLDPMLARLVGISISAEAGKGWYIPCGHDAMAVAEQIGIDRLRELLGPILAAEKPAKVGQHIKYDLNVLRRHGFALGGIASDTMLESYVFNSTATRHDMDSLAQRYLGRSTLKYEEICGKGKSQITFDQVPLDQATKYAAEDADITLALHQTLSEKLAEFPGQTALLKDLELPLVEVLADIEHRGVLLDTDHLNQLSVEFAQEMEQLQAQAYEAAGSEFNLNSPAQLKTILFEQLELPVRKKTPKGQPSTNEEVLVDLAQEHPLPQLILDFRSLSKLRSTYTTKLVDAVNPETGRVHTSYHQAIAATGRLSSADPNLQNIPVRSGSGRRIREAFVAPEGCALMSVDYSQIELRLMAHFSEDETLVKAFQEDRDVHQATAAEVFGVAPDEVEDDQRRAAKAINFGLIYGMSAFGLARQLKIERGKAQEWIDRFFERYPGVHDFMERTRAAAHDTGYVETLFGRRLYLPEINSKNYQHRQYAERTAINAPLQGTAADLIKRSMIDLHQWLPDNAPEIQMIMQVHDELVFEGPEAQIRAQAEAISKRMCAVAELKVPLLADCGIGQNWEAAH